LGSEAGAGSAGGGVGGVASGSDIVGYVLDEKTETGQSEGKLRALRVVGLDVCCEQVVRKKDVAGRQGSSALR
jgi:hypothetical protein